MTTNELPVLTTVKKSLGIDEDMTAFDDELITAVNTVFGTLNQLGIGPTHGFEIEDDSAQWSDFIGADDIMFSPMKTYVHLRVKAVFDPPAMSWHQTSLKDQIQELEWRLNVIREDMVDPAVEDALLTPPSGVYFIDGGGAEG